ncbi:hypothetical protein A3E17_01060 [Candidatus Amesbacteria bacterium RIFCSPHIGHO2_12_FULL_48_14]|uniref:Sortase n=4 Tax=Candidatus Amesiibacteriota TaxID=1752730 RepID=A0A1F4Z5G7_9BACT|nr:MAG: Sortase [Candidatus Amesbacteria bacterium GW2011_GWC1_48_10]OGD00184.1 MAG: hypothetical protein A2702_01855 [Candidatus Amesbacteria bacterium RIFCSPHIGHO2_01_FULL_48_75]OGD01250.1 MAG: hypothetical protein A2354_01420 [Candidatus Amesbacteria bacterium RIFOXYB1_FULL_47_12]OGD01545.1 MAG: hypothetical protein A3E17_01060 [Candidatus Amesbacteria bacterium RIFCSPHIGHO2_12_FULL_48_14]OGD04809.1 MAG: hypothetical protein A3B58_00415 [Candidatus Amesbacteria bacterium RIFCSPLOWO2_01_FULL_
MMTVSGIFALTGMGALVAREVKYSWMKTPAGRTIQRLEQVQPPKLVKEYQLGGVQQEEEKPEWKVPDEKYSVFIPQIGAISRVIPEVDAGDPGIYQAALKQGVAEAAGLGHPGQAETTYLFAHSVESKVDIARYNAVFYLLHKLVAGDKIEVVYQGRLYKYEVTGREILAATDVKYLVPQSQEEKLVLATCYPPGTTWKRLVVIAKRV